MEKQKLQAKELRIGNYVIFNTNDRPFPITAAGLAEVAQMEGQRHPFLYEAVKLTEELLLEFGFIKKKQWFYKEKFLLGYFSTSNNLQAEWKIGGAEGNWNLININYVHQLQNLYYTLTGLELVKEGVN